MKRKIEIEIEINPINDGSKLTLDDFAMLYEFARDNTLNQHHLLDLFHKFGKFVILLSRNQDNSIVAPIYKLNRCLKNKRKHIYF